MSTPRIPLLRSILRGFEHFKCPELNQLIKNMGEQSPLRLKEEQSAIIYHAVPCSRISRYLINSGNSHLDSLCDGAQLLLIQQLTSMQAWSVTKSSLHIVCLLTVIDSLSNDQMKQMTKQLIPLHSPFPSMLQTSHRLHIHLLSVLLYFFFSSLKIIFQTFRKDVSVEFKLLGRKTFPLPTQFHCLEPQNLTNEKIH